MQSDYIHKTGVTPVQTVKVAFTNATAWFLLPAVGVCFLGYAVASKSINTGMNNAKKDGLSEFI